MFTFGEGRIVESLISVWEERDIMKEEFREKLNKLTEEQKTEIKSEELSEVTGGKEGNSERASYIKVTNASGCLIWCTIGGPVTRKDFGRFPVGQSKTVYLTPDDYGARVFVQSDGLPEIINVVDEYVETPCCIEYRIKGTLFKMSYEKIEH